MVFCQKHIISDRLVDTTKLNQCRIAQMAIQYILRNRINSKIPFIFTALVILCVSNCSQFSGSEETYSADYFKGMNIFFMNSRNVYQPTEYDKTLDELLSAGINTVFVVTFHYAKTETSDSIFSTEETIPESTLCRIIEHTRSKGIEPILKPHIDLINGTPRYLCEPADINKWVDFYRDILLQYTRVSNLYGLKKFVIGTEIDKIADSKVFRSMIRNTVRQNFNGELLYASSFDHFISTAIWDDVDAIGVNAYLNLCRRDDCSLAELTESWNYWLNIIDRISISKGKPVYITEIGYYSRYGCAINPGDWQRRSEINLSEQAQAYEALLCQAYAFTNIKGIFWWQWELNNPWRSDSADYTPNGKPAEDVLRKYWNH